MKPPVVHSLKTLPAYFDAVWRGDKTFEVRLNDRCFQRHDVVSLERHDPAEGQGVSMSFNRIEKEITYVLPGGQFGIEPGYVVLGLGPRPDRFPCCHRHVEDGHAPGCQT
ncbi:MAG: DUF3850 domain-containing protein [Caulobacteraceae bacterium]|nr:DUF3850 domain-containing protein [Caulobacteraceae bacterium]